MKPGIRRMKMMAMIVFMTVIAVLFVQCNQNRAHETSVTNKAFIRPLLKFNIKYTRYMVKAGRDTTIVHVTGSKIHIPANSFVNADGTLIKGSLTIKYREMHTPWDILVSGIPMTIKKDSVTMHFESAGMFDIEGRQGLKKIYIAKGKNIKVDLASNNPGDIFNNYYLDTIAKQWVELGKSKKIAFSKKVLKDTSASELLSESVIQQPLKPRNAGSVIRLIEVRLIDKNKYPEFTPFPNMKFEVVEDHGQFRTGKPFKFTTATIIPSETKPGFYNLQMKIHNDDQTSFFADWLVRPAFEGDEYKKAMQIYSEQLTIYRKKLKEMKELKAKQEKERQIAMKRQATQDMLFRSIDVTKFGIYNCDYPLELHWPEYSPIFTANNTRLDMSEVIIIDSSINGIIRYNTAGNPSIRSNPEANQIICGIANDTLLYATTTAKLKDHDFTRDNSPIPLQKMSGEELKNKFNSFGK